MESCWLKKSQVNNGKEKSDSIHVTATQLDPRILLKKKTHYHFWSGRAEVDYKDPSNTQSVQLQIQSIYQNQTFLSVRAGGFGIYMEAATAWADADSVKAVNKINTEYYVYSFAQASKLLGAPLNFTQLQDLLVGNPLFDEGRIIAYDTLKNGVSLVSEKDGYLQSLFFEKNTMQLKEIKISNEQQQFDASITLSDYKMVDHTALFPHQREIIINWEGRQTVVNMNFIKVDFKTPFSIDFKIPKSYRLVH